MDIYILYTGYGSPKPWCSPQGCDFPMGVDPSPQYSSDLFRWCYNPQTPRAKWSRSERQNVSGRATSCSMFTSDTAVVKSKSQQPANLRSLSLCSCRHLKKKAEVTGLHLVLQDLASCRMILWFHEGKTCSCWPYVLKTLRGTCLIQCLDYEIHPPGTWTWNKDNKVILG